jgi:hypothetical protein
MSKVHYIAACPDERLMTCSHEHDTLTSAMACNRWAGGYVIAVEDGQFRALTDAEKLTAEGWHPARLTARTTAPTPCRITKKFTAEGRITRQEFARWLGMNGAA